MALLNPPGILPKAMWGVVRLLVATRGTSSLDQLTKLLSPQSLRGSDEEPMFNLAVGALRDVKLIERDGDAIALAPSLLALAPKTFEAFAHSLRAAVFDEQLNVEIGENGEQIGPKDLTRALAWLLTQDPFGEGLTWDAVQRMQTDAFPEHLGSPIRNDTRWNSLTYWAPALGLAEAPLFPSSTGSSLVPDPTRAIRHALTTFLPGAHPATQFLSLIQSSVPVLPSGLYSKALGLAADPEKLDRATSFALLRLHDESLISLDRRADAPQAILVVDLDAVGGSRLVTDITITGSSRG